MNYLAHSYLAGDDSDSVLGNLLADFVGPGDIAHYSPPVQSGIRLHQRIDRFTDDHPVVARSKQRMQPPYRRYAGVLVDVFYDHYLAAWWPRYSPDVTLEQFAQRTYAVLVENEALLPPRLRRMLPYMIEQDWLTSYRAIESIDLTLKRLSKRLKHENPLPEAICVLHECYDELESDFASFFPELIDFVRTTPSAKPGAKLNREQRFD